METVTMTVAFSLTLDMRRLKFRSKETKACSLSCRQYFILRDSRISYAEAPFSWLHFTPFFTHGFVSVFANSVRYM